MHAWGWRVREVLGHSLHLKTYICEPRRQHDILGTFQHRYMALSPFSINRACNGVLVALSSGEIYCRATYVLHTIYTRSKHTGPWNRPRATKQNTSTNHVSIPYQIHDSKALYRLTRLKRDLHNTHDSSDACYRRREL